MSFCNLMIFPVLEMYKDYHFNMNKKNDDLETNYPWKGIIYSE